MARKKDIPDQIIIQNLMVKALLGHTAQERAHLQDVWIDLEIETDLSRAAESDNLADTIDYTAIAAAVQVVFNQRSYQLAETVAQEVAAMLLAKFPIQGVTVRIKKKTIPNAAFAAVQITRTK